jgi:hypothetical protein
MSSIKTKNQKPKTKNSRGISVLFVVLIMGMMLAISLGISSILNQQTAVLRSVGFSVIAFYAADTGIEKILMEENPLTLNGYQEEMSNGAKYRLVVGVGGEGSCPAGNNYCIKSVGTYGETKRAIEINY